MTIIHTQLSSVVGGLLVVELSQGYPHLPKYLQGLIIYLGVKTMVQQYQLRLTRVLRQPSNQDITWVGITMDMPMFEYHIPK